MAEPGTIALAGMGASALSGVIGAVGSVFQGEGQAQQYEAQGRSLRYQAGVARMNRDIAQQNAAYEREAGEIEAQQSGMKTRAQVGQVKAVQAGSGIDVNRGSPVAVRESMLAVGAEDEAIIRANAARKAYGQEVEAVQHESQARIDEMGAESADRASSRARTSGYIGAASSILGSAASVSSRWLQYGRTFGNNPTPDYEGP